jgi:hypothetical protein
MSYDDKRPPWEKHPQPWTDVVIKEMQPPTGVHCSTCRCPRCNKIKQTVRMIRVACKSCGCICRMTRAWLERVGAPSCGCGVGGTMLEQIPKHLQREPGRCAPSRGSQTGRVAKLGKRIEAETKP